MQSPFCYQNLKPVHTSGQQNEKKCEAQNLFGQFHAAEQSIG